MTESRHSCHKVATKLSQTLTVFVETRQTPQPWHQVSASLQTMPSDLGHASAYRLLLSVKRQNTIQRISVQVETVGVCRLAELEDQIQQKSRELVMTKAQLECVEADKVDLKQRVDSLNNQKNNLEQIVKQSDKHGVVSCYSSSCSLVQFTK